MARAIWKGAISFGLVTVPVRLYSATEEKSLKFHLMRESDGSRIRYQRVAEADNEPVEWSDMVRGYEYSKGKYVTFTDEELSDIHGESSRLIDIVSFVPLEEVDPIYYRKAYYLGPDGKAATKAYRLLIRALEESGRVALAKVSIRERQYLATLRPRDDVFVLETMFWDDEIRKPELEFLDERVQVRDNELKMARQLIETLSDEFHPEAFIDETRRALEGAVSKKVEGEEIVAPEPAPAGKVVDLMDALKASVERAKAKGDEKAAEG